MAEGSSYTLVHQLLAALGEPGETLFVVRNADALSELAGPLRVSVERGWATLERNGCSCHIHLRLEQMAEARFVQEPGFTAGTTAHCVQLFHVAGDRPVLTIYLPVAAYQDVLGRFGGRERIAFGTGSGES